MRFYQKLYSLCSEITESQLDFMIIALLCGLIADAVFSYCCIASWLGPEHSILLCIFLTALFLFAAGFLMLMVSIFICSIPEDKLAVPLLIFSSILFLLLTIAYGAFPFYLCMIHKQPLSSVILSSVIHLICWIFEAIQVILFVFAASINPPDYEE